MLKSLLLILLLVVPTVAGAADNDESMLVVTEHSPPLSFTDAKGNVSGTATLLVRQILAEAGLDYRIRVYPWVRAHKIAQAHPNVLIYTIAHHKQRSSNFHWFCPLTITGPVHLYHLAERPKPRLNSLADLKQYSLGITTDGLTYRFLIEHGFKAAQELDISAYEVTNIKKLLSGRIDFLPMTELSLQRHLADLGVDRDKLQRSMTLYDSTDFPKCMAVSLGTPQDILARIQAAFDKVVGDASPVE